MSGRAPDLEEALQERKRKKKRRRVILDDDEDEEDDKTVCFSGPPTPLEVPSASQERAVGANDRTQHSPPAVVSRTSPATTFPPQPQHQDQDERNWKLILLMDSSEWKGTGENQARVLSHLQARNIWVQLQDGMAAAMGSLYLFAVVPILNNSTTNSASTMLILDTIITRIRGDHDQWIQDRVSFRTQLDKLKATDLSARMLIAENVHDDSFQEVCHGIDPHLQVHPTTSAKTSLKIIKKLYKDYLQQLPASFDELRRQLNLTTYSELVSKVEQHEQSGDMPASRRNEASESSNQTNDLALRKAKDETGSSSARSSNLPAPDAVKSASASLPQPAATPFQPVPRSTPNDSQSQEESASSGLSVVGVSANNSHPIQRPQQQTKQAFHPPPPSANTKAPAAFAPLQVRTNRKQQFPSSSTSTKNAEPNPHHPNQHRKTKNRNDESAGYSEPTTMQARLFREEKDTTTSAFSVRKRSTTTSAVPIIPPGAFPRQAQEQAQANLQLLLQQVVRSLDFAKSVPELMRLRALLKKLQDQTTSRLDEIYNKYPPVCVQECCQVIQRNQRRIHKKLEQSLRQLYQSVVRSKYGFATNNDRNMQDIELLVPSLQHCFAQAQQVIEKIETQATQHLEQAVQRWYRSITCGVLEQAQTSNCLLWSLQPILHQVVTLERQSWSALLHELQDLHATTYTGWSISQRECERAIQEAQTVRLVELTAACHRLQEALLREPQP